ncbi:MAG: PadR family transcriptional regulator [Candidatus Babeliales bacterium]
MAKNAKSQFAILGMLALLKKSSGYDLKKHMEASTQYFWKETFSSIYPVLEELEKQKLIKKVDVPTKSDRKRNVYTLTAAGKKALENWLVKQPEEIQLRNELLLKLFFGKLVPAKVTLEHLKNYKKELEKKLASFQKIKHELPDDDSLEALYGLITLDHGIRQASSALEWCKHALKRLTSVKH